MARTRIDSAMKSTIRVFMIAGESYDGAVDIEATHVDDADGVLTVYSDQTVVGVFKVYTGWVKGSSLA